MLGTVQSGGGASHAAPRGRRSRGVPPSTPPVALRAPYKQHRTPAMRIVEAPDSSPPKRGGGKSIDTDLLRSIRLDLDLNPAELTELKKSAKAASLPLRRWARRVLLGRKISAAQPLELRRLWTESSTLQSNFNQLVSRLDELRVAGALNASTVGEHLAALLIVVPDLHHLVRLMRVELASLRSAS